MRFWNLRQSMDDPADGVLDIDGEIVAEKDWFTPSGAIIAKDFRNALKGIKNVTVRINSPGGDVMAGAEIYSALREHSMNGEGRVKIVITALAASAASVIAMAGDEIAMYPTSYMLIHNPWSVAAGDARKMRKTAKVLDEIAEGLINAYEQRTGKSRDELERMLDAETWMSAGTCVEEGFADYIIGAESRGAAVAMVRMSAKAHGAGEIVARIREDAGHDETDTRACEQKHTDGRSYVEIVTSGIRFGTLPTNRLKDWQKAAMADDGFNPAEAAAALTRLEAQQAEQDEDRKRRELLAWAIMADAEE